MKEPGMAQEVRLEEKHRGTNYGCAEPATENKSCYQDEDR